MTPTERAAVAEAIEALEQIKKMGSPAGPIRERADIALASLRALAPAPADHKACEHDWVIWPETDGQEQKCMKCGAYRRTPADQSDAGRDGVIEEVKQAIFDILCPGIRQTPEDDETYRSVALAATRLIAERCAAICDAEESNYLTRMAQSIGERARYKAHANVCRKMAALIRTLAPAPSEAPKPPGQEPGGDPGVGRGEDKPYPPSDMDILAGQRDQALEGLTKQKARIRELEKLNGGLSEKVRNLTALLDQKFGTPCEEIRHAQEVEKLQALALPTADRNAIREALKEAKRYFDRYAYAQNSASRSTPDDVKRNIRDLTAALALIGEGK